MVPVEPTAKAIQSFRAGSRRLFGCTTVPTPGTPATTASRTSPSREACAITALTPDQAAILAAASLDAIPPLPRAQPVPPAERLERVVHLHDLLDQRRRRVEPRIGGEQARRVGEQHQQVGGQQVGDERRQAVVVAEADLVVGDGVVLVHHRDHAEVEQPTERGPGVEVLLTDGEVEGGEEHLAAHQPVRRPARLVDPHEAGLPHRRGRLQRDGVARPIARHCRTRGRAGPAAMAPEVTSTTRWPWARRAAVSAQNLPTAAASMSPSAVVIDDVPILVTTITGRPRSRRPGDRCARCRRAGTGPGQRLVDAEGLADGGGPRPGPRRW